MRVLARLGLLFLGSVAGAAAQTPCMPNALEGAAKTVAQIRRQLQSQAVPEADPTVPPAVAAQLAQLKDALAAAAQAALACAPAGIAPEVLQKSLADALRANRSSSEETFVETRRKQDIGAYGSDLGVQVLPLYDRPRFLEVDFRYGVECGDDHLLLVFETASDTDAPDWRERLRWSAPAYNTVADALGDFVMLTPLTGSYKTPTWRFVVAHGHPGCGVGAVRPSHFDLDLLSLSADPARPHVDWHFEHAYTQGHVRPQLATTEDTVEFRMIPDAVPGHPGTPVPAPEIYRFHLAANGQLAPSSSNTDEVPAAGPPTSSSPQ